VTPAQGALYAGGALVEVVGLGFVAAPDLVPGARRFSRWLTPRWRAFENRVRRVLRIRPRSTTHYVEMAGTAAGAASVSGVLSIGTGTTTLEEQVEFLLRRNEQAQKEVNALVERVATLERDMPRRLDELRESLEASMTTELGAALTEYRPTRIIGAFLVVIGLTLSTVANFLG
jgi:hypothetical protein